MYNSYTIYMRYKYDRDKSLQLKNNPRRGIGFEEACEIWNHPYYEDCRSDIPKQFRVIGWVRDVLYSVIYEIRYDEEGEYVYMVTLWKATKEERKLYEKNS